MIANFLLLHVLTTRLAYKDERSTITDRFNGLLEGKCLVINEEFHMPTKDEFYKAMDIIKDFITGKTMLIEKKGIDKYTVKNNINFLFISNYNSIKPTQNSKRRWFSLDFARDGKPNYEQLDRLDKATKNPEVAKCFYRYCIENVDLKFRPFEEIKEITTDSKINNIIDTLEDCRKFMKYKFMKENIELYKQPFQSFWKKYVNKYKIDEKFEKTHKREVLEIFRGDGIVIKEGTARALTFFTHTKDIYKTYLNNNWISEVDEIHYEDVDDKDVKDDVIEEIKTEKDNKIEQQQKEIDDLKKQNEEIKTEKNNKIKEQEKELEELKKQIEELKKQPKEKQDKQKLMDRFEGCVHGFREEVLKFEEENKNESLMDITIKCSEYKVFNKMLNDRTEQLNYCKNTIAFMISNGTLNGQSFSINACNFDESVQNMAHELWEKNDKNYVKNSEEEEPEEERKPTIKKGKSKKKK
jgi:hypothetical protein